MVQFLVEPIATEISDHQVDIDADVSRYLSDIFLILKHPGVCSLPYPGKGNQNGEKIKRKGIDEAAIIGEIIDEPKERIIVRLAAKK